MHPRLARLERASRTASVSSQVRTMVMTLMMAVAVAVVVVALILVWQFAQLLFGLRHGDCCVTYLPENAC